LNNERIFEVRNNNQGTPMKIIRYGSISDIDIQFMDEYGHIVQSHDNVNQFILDTEGSDFELGRKQLMNHIQHQFAIGKPVEINGNLYWLTDSNQHLVDVLDDIENTWNKEHGE